VDIGHSGGGRTRTIIMVPWTRALQQRYYFRGGVPPVRRRRVSQCCHTRKNAHRPRSAGTRRRHLAPTRPNERNGRRDDRSSLRRRLSRTHARTRDTTQHSHARAGVSPVERTGGGGFHLFLRFVFWSH